LGRCVRRGANKRRRADRRQDIPETAAGTIHRSRRYAGCVADSVR
jgi:hypothetical protein